MLGKPWTEDFKGPNVIFPGHPGDYEMYRMAFSQYQSRQMKMFPVFTNEFYNPYPQRDYSSDSYRELFALRIKDFVTYMKNNGVNFESIIIWNEPNINNMSHDDFMRMIYKCWRTFHDDPAFVNNMSNIYWGGIWMSIGSYISELMYIENCYKWMISDPGSPMVTGQINSFPWFGINVHIHRSRDNDEVYDILRTSRGTQRSFGNIGEMIIGEWGIIMLEDTPDDLSALYSQIRQSTKSAPSLPNIMFYFSHHNVQDDAGTWGLRWSTGNLSVNGLNRYTLDPYDHSEDPDHPRQKAKRLRNRYASIMGGTPIS